MKEWTPENIAILRHYLKYLCSVQDDITHANEKHLYETLYEKQIIRTELISNIIHFCTSDKE